MVDQRGLVRREVVLVDVGTYMLIILDNVPFIWKYS